MNKNYGHAILKRFIKDYSLPIQVVQEPYFSYFMGLYNEHYGTLKKFKLLEKAIDFCGGEDKFLQNYNIIKDEILNTMHNNPAYIEFNTMDMSKYDVPFRGLRTKDIFNEGNVGKKFLSIDLKKANFQAFFNVDPKIVLDSVWYDDFMQKFTKLDYMIESKYLRQVIFGNLNPKRQIKVERFLTEKILEVLLESGIPIEDIKMVSADEIVLERKPASGWVNAESLDNELEKRDIDLILDVEEYTLNQIKPFKFFVKEFNRKFTGKDYELMCIPVVYHAQAYKIYNNLPIGEADRVFFYENQLARFEKNLNELDWGKVEDGDDETEGDI